jgi:hypothetical protein
MSRDFQYEREGDLWFLKLCVKGAKFAIVGGIIYLLLVLMFGI